MEINKLYDNLVKARDENVPKGIEFAWCDVHGNHVRWDDLVNTVAHLVGFEENSKPQEVVEESQNEQV